MRSTSAELSTTTPTLANSVATAPPDVEATTALDATPALSSTMNDSSEVSLEPTCNAARGDRKGSYMRINTDTHGATVTRHTRHSQEADGHAEPPGLDAVWHRQYRRHWTS